MKSGIIAKKFPDELGTRLPLKRLSWMSEPYHMGIFDAVALAVMIPLNKTKAGWRMAMNYSEKNGRKMEFRNGWKYSQ
jgi:hypothetical protein